MQSNISFHLSNGEKAAKSFLGEYRATFHFTSVMVKISEVIPKRMQSYVSFHLSNDEKAPKSFLWCWGLVLKCYELRTRQHKMLNIDALRPLKHYLPKDLMNFGRRP
jgi:hypothetical protein